ncbi:hypothetical protein O3P69_016302 [Scylla paramamosain]|uniref:Uncharacterized protein n=1 Tax=Scylla paramamosain TaxID=85552 RepID=A0AAW0S9F5_SCYPA
MVSFLMVVAPPGERLPTQPGSRRALVLPVVHPSQVRLIHRGPFWREPLTCSLGPVDGSGSADPRLPHRLVPETTTSRQQDPGSQGRATGSNAA